MKASAVKATIDTNVGRSANTSRDVRRVATAAIDTRRIWSLGLMTKIAKMAKVV